MASGAIDHMVSLIIFIAAIMIFIGLFSQNMQTSIAYERHNVLSTKTSDLLDNMLLNPGIPSTWGQSDDAIIGFGLQNPDYSQYKLSSFSLMRLASTQAAVYYPRTATYYSNNSARLSSCLLVPSAETLNYSIISKLLGINGTYGFQLTLTPTITFNFQKTSICSPLTVQVNVDGTGYPLANAHVSYSLIIITQGADNYPSYTVVKGISATDGAGLVELVFPQITSESQSYALIIYSKLDGLKGIGYYVNNPSDLTKTIIPLIDSFQNRTILLTHSDSIGQPSQPPGYSELSYNASFFILTEDYTLRQVQLNQQNAVGNLSYGSGSELDYTSITVPNNDGIFIITYKSNSGQFGIILMPWGLGSLAFPLKFGGNPAGQDWVTTDIRQVTVGSITYQAQLGLWNLQGYSRTG
jgi:hypothetical protein